MNLFNVFNHFTPFDWSLYILIIFILIFLYIYLYNRYPIQYYIPFLRPNFKDKTFIMVWTQYAVNNKDYWGLGDIIRGTIFMYKLSKELKFKLYIDISNHPVSKFLNYDSKHPFQKLIYDNRNNIPFIGFLGEEVQDYLYKNFFQKDIVFGITNGLDSEFMNVVNPLETDIQKLLQHILTPNSFLQKIIQEQLDKLPKPFIALHFRVGDMSSLVSNKVQIDEDTAIQQIQKHLKPNTVFFSDSQTLKNIVYTHFYTDIHMFHHDIGHLGYHAEDIKVFNSLVEFFVLSKAQSIHSITSYNWVSNFINAIHKIYSVPLTFQLDNLELTQKPNYKNSWEWLHHNHLTEVLNNR